MKIALIGYGKMGHMIEQIALERGHEIVCKIDVNNQDDFDSPAFASPRLLTVTTCAPLLTTSRW